VVSSFNTNGMILVGKLQPDPILGAVLVYNAI